jgi:3-oxoadipate enol-lactonase
MQVFADDGACIDVRIDGANGDPIVLLAGFPLTRDIWDTCAESLARRYRVVRPDLRGVGASSVPDGPYLMDLLAADVAAVLDALGIERATIVGHSMGGYAALAFARMYTERIARIVLVCSRLAADTPEQAAARRQLADRVELEQTMEPVIEAYLPRLFAPRTLRERPALFESARRIARLNDPRGAAALLRGMALRNPSDDIATDLKMPMAMIAGAGDAVIPVAEARSIAAAFPQGRLWLCERSGHLPMLEEPGAVTEALGQLLSE